MAFTGNLNNIPETGIGIKRAGALDYVPKEELEQRIKDIAHAKRDIVWWAENFFYIVTLDTGLQKIQLYQKQKELLEFFKDNNRIITLAARQTGKCVYKNTNITIRNKKNKKVITIPIDEFFNLVANKQKQNKIATS